MELMPVRESRVWTLILLGTALVVGVPLIVWRSLVDEEVGEAAQVFVIAAGAALFIVAAVSVLRTRRSLRRAKPAPAGLTVSGPNRGWRLACAGLGFLGGIAPFARSGFDDSSPVFAAFGHGFVAGAAAAVAIGLLYLRRREHEAGKRLLMAPQGSSRRAGYFLG